MRRFIFLVALVGMMIATDAGVTTHLTLDCRTDVRTMATDGEALLYDTSWYDNATIVKLYDNGSLIGSGTEGMLLWKSEVCGDHLLTLKALSSDGSQVASESAAFFEAHKSVEAVAATAATCTATGRAAGTRCSVCGTVLSGCETIAALGHVEVVVVPAQEPTCTEEGCTKGTRCSRCNATLEVSRSLPAAHCECVTTKAKAATCTDFGCTKGSYCSRCDEILSVSKVISSLGHDPVEILAAIEPTVRTAGRTARIKCARCGIILQESEILPAGYIRNFRVRELKPFRVWEISYDIDGVIEEVLQKESVAKVGCNSFSCATTNDKNGNWSDETTYESYWSNGRRYYSWKHRNLTAVFGGFDKILFNWWYESGYPVPDLYLTIDERNLGAQKTDTNLESSLPDTESGVNIVMWNITGAANREASKNGWNFYYGNFGLGDVKLISTNSTFGGNAVVNSGRHVLYKDYRNISGVDQLSTSIAVDLGDVAGIDKKLLKAEATDLQMDFLNYQSGVLSVTGCQEVAYSVLDSDLAKVFIDGTCVASSSECGSLMWRPCETGIHEIVHVAGTNRWSQMVDVKETYLQHDPIPCAPTEKDPAIALASQRYEISSVGGSKMVATSGSGNWTAVSSVDWITIPEAFASRAAGLPVVYQVSENLDAISRKGYIYVSGHIFEVTQLGANLTLMSYTGNYEKEGGCGTIGVQTQSGASWIATTTADWIFVKNVQSNGMCEISYNVAPWYEPSVRTGTIAIGGQTFTITQYGQRIKLDRNDVDVSYKGQNVAVVVTAIATEEWSVATEVDWLSANVASGVGGKTITVKISENTSYFPREGVVCVGTERFCVKQSGRTGSALSLSTSLTGSPVSENGGSIRLDVKATSDLPWTVKIGSQWIELDGVSAGSGNGSAQCSVAANTTLLDRVGTITVTPATGSGLTAKSVQVKQKAATAKISASSYEFGEKGGSFVIGVTVSNLVEWAVENTNDWVIVPGGANRIGPGTVTVTVPANPSVNSRVSSIRIANCRFDIIQEGHPSVSVERDSVVLSKTDGSCSLKVSTESGIQWTAISSDPSWLCVLAGQNCVYDAQGNVSGSGNGTIEILVTDYAGAGSRVGSITIGGVKISVIQGSGDYEIKFDANGGEGSMSEIEGLISENRKLPANDYTRSGYDFVGWASDRDVVARWQPGDRINPLVDEFGSNFTLYASWSWMPTGEAIVTKEKAGGLDLKINATWITDSLVKRYGASTKERFLQKFGDDLSKALLKSTVKVNGQAMQVWQDYVAGTDPTDSNSVFTAKVRVENGLPVVEWEPNLNSNGEERVYTVWGKTNLADAVWHTPTNECSKFFKVDVAMPETKGEVSFDLGDASGAIDSLSDASYKSFLNCSSTTIWSGVQLSQVTNIVGYLSGKGINGGTNAVRVVGCCFKDETDGKSVQFQAALGDYIKCVKVRLMQAGNDVRGYVQYAGCLDRSHGVGVDFDNEKYTVKFVATSDCGEWYGVKNLCAFVNRTQDLADATSLYCVIDLSELNSDGRYEVSCLTNVPAGGWTDEYKTTKLVLRRIEAGSFIMGEDQADESHRVILTNPFYIGVFEVTQKQWYLVVGDNPAGTSYNARPIVNVSYDDVRGATLGAAWPTSGDVDAASFVGIISTRTGLHMELPTEAQWEYAARAGTQGKYANAGSFNTSYIHSQASASTEVGSKLPNDWGLYDMLGNVWELCRDWFGDLEYGDDPVGVATATERMRRGGSYDDRSGQYSNVIFRSGVSPSSKDDGVGHANIGFRLVLEL